MKTSFLSISDKNLEELSQQIKLTYNNLHALNQKIRSANKKLIFLNFLYFPSRLTLLRAIYSKIKDKKDAQSARIKELKNKKDGYVLTVSISNLDKVKDDWQNFLNSFNTVVKTGAVWDIVYEDSVNRIESRTIAQKAYDRKEIIYKEKNLAWILCDLKCLYLPNKQGNDIFLYPTFFVVLEKNGKKVQVYGIKDLRITIEKTAYIEEEDLPSKTKVVDHTWKMTNMDSSIDRRFKSNYKIPVVEYGIMRIFSKDVDEAYMFSNVENLTGLKDSCGKVGLLNNIL